MRKRSFRHITPEEKLAEDEAKQNIEDFRRNRREEKENMERLCTQGDQADSDPNDFTQQWDAANRNRKEELYEEHRVAHIQHAIPVIEAFCTLMNQIENIYPNNYPRPKTTPDVSYVIQILNDTADTATVEHKNDMLDSVGSVAYRSRPFIVSASISSTICAVPELINLINIMRADWSASPLQGPLVFRYTLDRVYYGINRMQKYIKGRNLHNDDDELWRQLNAPFADFKRAVLDWVRYDKDDTIHAGKDNLIETEYGGYDADYDLVDEAMMLQMTGVKNRAGVNSDDESNGGGRRPRARTTRKRSPRRRKRSPRRRKRSPRRRKRARTARTVL
jgi:hypothetical protein